MEEYDAILKEWKIVESSNTPGKYSIVGKVWEDKRDRFYNDSLIKTSHVKFIDLEKMIAKTRNTTYKLD